MLGIATQSATIRPTSSIVLANPGAADGNYHAIRDPTPHIPDSVCQSQNRQCQSYVNYHAVHPPTPRFCDRVDRYASEPSLSRGKGAIVVPKVPRSTAYFLGRLKMAGISTQSAILRPTSPIMLANPTTDAGNCHAIRDHTPHILDSVGKSRSC